MHQKISDIEEATSLFSPLAFNTSNKVTFLIKRGKSNTQKGERRYALKFTESLMHTVTAFQRYKQQLAWAQHKQVLTSIPVDLHTLPSREDCCQQSLQAAGRSQCISPPALPSIL